MILTEKLSTAIKGMKENSFLITQAKLFKKKDAS